MFQSLAPCTEDELIEVIRWAMSGPHPLELIGSGSKRLLGRPMQVEQTLNLSSFAGISEYNPAELVITAGAGTPLSDVEAVLLENGQMLAFEPASYANMLGGKSSGTLGGIVACNVSGPRRISAGAARDHLLGFSAVSGRGESFKSGGKVHKNVTGYDLCKIMTGSWGTLAAIHEVSLKVLPIPEIVRTLIVPGLTDDQAISLLSQGMASSTNISAAAHLPTEIAVQSQVQGISKLGTAITAMRIEGVRGSVESRTTELQSLFSSFGILDSLHTHNSQVFWTEVRDASFFDGNKDILWRLSAPPISGDKVVSELKKLAEVSVYYDWAGGLIWVSLSSGIEIDFRLVNKIATEYGGHATLMRAPENIRAIAPVFHPQPKVIAALTGRLKESFDPFGILNPGRMYLGT